MKKRQGTGKEGSASAGDPIVFSGLNGEALQQLLIDYSDKSAHIFDLFEIGGGHGFFRQLVELAETLFNRKQIILMRPEPVIRGKTGRILLHLFENATKFLTGFRKRLNIFLPV